jgi:plasmid stabilization system protein ParE
VTSRRTVLAPEAERDIADAFRWYRERNVLVADTFRVQVFASIERIAAAPLAHPADDNGLRRRVLRQFPYSVHYEVSDDLVTVLAVAHHRRRPGYWRA